MRWKHISLDFRFLREAFKTSLESLMSSGTCPPNVVMWLLTIGSISVFTKSDDWDWVDASLQQSFNACGYARDMVRFLKIVNSVMWIGIIHDKPAQRVHSAVSGENAPFSAGIAVSE